ncbi:hypothetical protein AM593_01104, partial [Mytilus galloprovincialis]
MRGLIVTILSSLIICMYGTPLNPPRYCNPCQGGKYTSLIPRRDYGVTKDALSNEVVNFYQVLNTAYTRESAALTQSPSRNDFRDLTPPCPKPTRHSIRAWITCVYDKLSDTLKNVTDNSIYSSTLNTNDIVAAVREVEEKAIEKGEKINVKEGKTKIENVKEEIKIKINLKEEIIKEIIKENSIEDEIKIESIKRSQIG